MKGFIVKTLREQTADFYAELSFRRRRRWVDVDKFRHGGSFELRLLVATRTSKFFQSEKYMQKLLDHLNDKIESKFVWQSFLELGRTFPLETLWKKEMVLALDRMVKTENEFVLDFCAGVVAACIPKIKEGNLSASEFCRSPFAQKMLRAIPLDCDQKLKWKVWSLVRGSPEQFVLEPWIHEYSWANQLHHNEAEPLDVWLDVAYDEIDFLDTQYLKDVEAYESFLNKLFAPQLTF